MNTTRRRLSAGLFGLPMLPLLPACGGVNGDSEGKAAGGEAVADAKTPDGSAGSPAGRIPASQSGVFRHPGLLVTEDDFTRIRAHIKAGQEPWTGWWNKLSADRFASLDTRPFPLPAVYRADGSKNNLYVDIWRAWTLTLRWKLSDPPDNRYADKAVEFLDAWASTLKEVGTVPPGSTAHDDHTFILMAGMQGHQLAQIGEILRTYPGWAPESLKRFQDMLLKVFGSISSWFLSDGRIGSHANWDMASIVGAMAIGIFCDQPDLYRLACDCYAGNNRGKLRNFGNGSMVHGVYFMHPGHFGQWEESGRDQGHATLGMSLGGDVMEMAWNQGDDLYGLGNNRFLSAAEYVARSNLLDENGKPYPMPFAREHNPTQPHTSLWTEVNQSFQHGRNAWEPIYNHYVNRMGLAAPNVARMVKLCEPKYGGSSDDIWWPTLIHRRADYAAPMKPASGLTAHARGERVVLSWWGSVGATAYAVRRGSRATGPFTLLGTVSASEVLTYSDAPPSGVWFYQVTAQGNGASASSPAVRAVMPGEDRLSLPLNGRNGTETFGALLGADGNRSVIEGKLLDGAAWGDGRRDDKAIVFDGKKGGPAVARRDLQRARGLHRVAVGVCECAALGHLPVLRRERRLLLPVHRAAERPWRAAIRHCRRDPQRLARHGGAGALAHPALGPCGGDAPGGHRAALPRRRGGGEGRRHPAVAAAGRRPGHLPRSQLGASVLQRPHPGLPRSGGRIERCRDRGAGEVTPPLKAPSRSI